MSNRKFKLKKKEVSILPAVNLQASCDTFSDCCDW